MLGAPGERGGRAPAVDLFAVLLCLLIAYRPQPRVCASAARFETWLVYLKVAIVLLVIVVGFFYIKAANYVPFFPFGLGGAFAGAATVFFAVFGYDAMSTAAEESKDSQRHMPKAILYSLAISMVLYVLACLVLTGMQSTTGTSTPRRRSPRRSRTVGLPGAGAVIAVGAIVGILTVHVHVPARGASRVGYSMSRDGLLPAWLSQHLADDPRADPDHLDPRRRVRADRRVPADRRGGGADEHRDPAGVRRRVHRGGRAALPAARPAADVPLPRDAGGAVVGVGFSIWLISFLDPVTWLRFAVWFLLGLVIYLVYGRRRSRLARR